VVLEMSRDKHPHKLLGSRKGIQTIIDSVKRQEQGGLIFQAALLLKNFAEKHIFDGANHRTAYAVAKSFLTRNGKRFRVSTLNEAYPFIKNVEGKTIDEIQRWIEYGEEGVPRKP
jgi:prophage maintenance system killer protein